MIIHNNKYVEYKNTKNVKEDDNEYNELDFMEKYERLSNTIEL